MQRPLGPGPIRLIVLIFLGLAIASRGLVFGIPGYRGWVASLPSPLPWLEQPLRWTVICIGALLLLHGPAPGRWVRDIGLGAAPGRALLVAIAATTPLLLGPLFFGVSANTSSSARLVLFTALVWPLGEELLFRGFAFGQLTACGRLSLWPAALLTGLTFGVVHLGQASVQRLPLGGQLGTVAVITAGGLLFSWLFARWGRNLWAPLAVHGLMNLGWELWALDQSPLGTGLANGLRAGSVLLVILLTFRFAPRLPAPLEANAHVA